MCLITDQQFPAEAVEDIVVYKVLSGLDSPFNDFSYEIGKLYKTEIKISEEQTCLDDQDDEDLQKAYGNWKNALDEGVLFSYGEGFHSTYKKERLLGEFYYQDVYECIIPKGSLYYDNPSGLVVSNQIIIKEKVKSK